MMNKPPLRCAPLAALTSLALAAMLAACGGGGDDSARAADAAPGTATIQRIATPAPGASSPLPTTAPAPDVLVRESFGMGPDSQRPAGGKGDLRAAFAGVSLAGFWVEWPGNKNTAWQAAPETGQTWRLCATYPSPGELPSPLQGDEASGFVGAGCAHSQFRDLPIGVIPTALQPFTPPAATPWSVSISAWPAPVAGTYVALGLSSSGVLVSNFETVGDVWLSLTRQEIAGNSLLTYELRRNGRTGPLLATGSFVDQTWNQLVLRYDPVAQQLSASAGGVLLGSFPMKLAPRYAGFEGVGTVDNFVIRTGAGALQ